MLSQRPSLDSSYREGFNDLETNANDTANNNNTEYQEQLRDDSNTDSRPSRAGANPKGIPRDNDLLSCGMTESLVARVRRMVEPAYLRDVRDTLSGRFHWRKVGDASEAASRILEGAAAVLAFAAGTYDMFELSFAAGCTATTAMVLGLWTNYAHRESRERARELNALLKTLHLPEMPDLAQAQDKVTERA